MNTLITISAIISILSAVGGVAVSGYQHVLTNKNSSIGRAIKDLSNAITTWIKGDRQKLNRLIALVNSGNTTALMNALASNPVTGNLMDQIQERSDLIAMIQADQNTLESEINDLKNDLNSLQYNQGHKEAWKSAKMVEETKTKIKTKQGEYDDLVNKAQEIASKRIGTAAPDTSHLDAISQNIKGGLQ